MRTKKNFESMGLEISLLERIFKMVLIVTLSGIIQTQDDGTLSLKFLPLRSTKDAYYLTQCSQKITLLYLDCTRN